jgi:hypothetical protein
MKYLKARLIFLVLFVALFPMKNIAQEASRINVNTPYVFSTGSTIYTYLSEGTTVPALSADQEVSDKLPIGFLFQLGGETYADFYASSNGTLSFNNPFVDQFNGSYVLSLRRYTYLTLLAPFWDDLSGEGGTFSYKTIGMAPNQIFIAEWKNWKWYYNAASAVISFQVKLYEGSNTIEYIYKQEPTPNTTSVSASIGMYNGNTLNTEAKQLWLNNSSVRPVASRKFTDTINTRPASGQVYRFTPKDNDASCR